MTSKQPSDPNKKLVKADPTTIRGKFLVGYRGWFTCPGDGPPLVQGSEWAHWNDDQGQFNAELIPDPEYYSASDLAVMPHSRHQVFSSRNVNVIRRHLNIMAMHGIDGLFITRRGTEIAAAYQPGGNGIGIMKLRSEGINNIFRAAEQEGRVVGIMYDLAGMPSHQIEQWTAGDWDFMVGQKHVLDSPAYVHEHGAPVVALWSVGFKHAGQDPEMIMRLLGRIREISGSAYIILGVPVTWQKQDANWQAVYQTADALAPMSIGTLVDEEGVNNWSKDVQQPAIQAFKAAQRKTDYVSVVWPGNEEQLVNNMGMSTGPAPRQDGAFLWRQVYNAHRDGARLIYAEMFDGFDDGTAILPSLGAQSDNTPSDWYLRICGYASEALKGEKRLYEELPRKELAEYWSVRPHYAENQEDGSSSGPAGGSGSSQPQAGASGPALAVPQRAPTRSMTAEVADAPPPYSLEASAPVSTPSAGAVFTAEPESAPSPPPTNPAPGPQPQYHSPPVGPGDDRPRPPRVDSTHSIGSASSYPGQHRPEPIAVPTTGHHQMGIPVQTPASYHSTSPGYTPSGYPGASPGPHTPSTGHASPPMHGAPLPMHNRPPQHPAVAGRPPPTTAPRPPSRPGRPPSAASGSSNPHSSPPPMPYGPGGNVHQLTNQMQGMNVGDRPAPEHVFAGIGQTRPQMTGTPASPFEGTNVPGRFGQQQQDSPGLFGPPQPPRHQNSYGSGYESPQTPPTGIPGNPFYPGPLQHGHGHHAPTHQGTIGPGHPPPGPVHQGTIGPGQHHPAHQATLGPSSPHPGQPPQPTFQQHQPYVPHHQPTSPFAPPQGPSGPGYFGPGGQPPQPNAPPGGTYSPHSGGPSPQPPQPNAPGGWPGASPGGSPYNLPVAGGFVPPAAGGSHGYPSQPGQPPQPGQPGQPSQPLVPGQPQGPYGGFGAGPQPPPVHPLRPPIPGGQYFDSAMGAVGRYAGEDKKKKLEQGMASAFTAGTKLWGKFNK